MADRRIDQLTEAEDISDEDLFVIWKENISQTRSIKMQTMGLATKSYVDSRMPDYSNAISINLSTLHTTGYTAPSDGIIVGWSVPTVGVSYATVNGIVISRADQISSSYVSFANVQCLVSANDVFKISNAQESGNYSFVPFKSES